jgi:hypothetical protein
LISDAVGFPFKWIIRLADCEFGLNESAEIAIAERSLDLKQRIRCKVRRDRGRTWTVHLDFTLASLGN